MLGDHVLSFWSVICELLAQCVAAYPSAPHTSLDFPNSVARRENSGDQVGNDGDSSLVRGMWKVLQFSPWHCALSEPEVMFYHVLV